MSEPSVVQAIYQFKGTNNDEVKIVQSNRTILIILLLL